MIEAHCTRCQKIQKLTIKETIAKEPEEYTKARRAMTPDRKDYYPTRMAFCSVCGQYAGFL